ncbi:hypothetical protein NW762_014088 [Fusarium torreyae]|uniref:Transaldolase n=1 Tax=Fusarium torreyae TaxID=1237075 RepID=A0A9W8V9P7_9HYPO|nr:hypothetical protein NW762_014088 [Fusarium torreyae]
MPARTLLTRLNELCNVDVDDADYDFISSLPLKPYNQTSNQVVITEAMTLPRNQSIFQDCLREYGSEGWGTVYEKVTVRICAKNASLISGRLLVQTSPEHLHNRDEIINQCRRFAESFAQEGLSKDRFAIKLPFTGAAACAAQQLNAEGIKTLATSVFCLEQAIAASQSQCLLISPYFEEIAAHTDLSQRPQVKDTALEHPMSPRIIHMLEAFTTLYKQTGQEQPIMVIASHFHSEQLMAMAELGCQHITISQDNLRRLMSTQDDLPPVTQAKPSHPYAGLSTPERLRSLSKLDPLAKADWDGILASLDVDYLEDNGAKLDQAIKQDSVSGKRIHDAMERFVKAEQRAKNLIEAETNKIAYV